jgi:hypothetical protein
MVFDPQAVGFAWPQETVLTSPTGETMTIRPYAANFAGIRDAQGHRIEECYRYYTSICGIQTELEIKKWWAGGDQECLRLVREVKSLLARSEVGRLPLESVIAALDGQGFAQATILVNMKWLLQEGSVSASCEEGTWFLEQRA